MLKNLEHTEFTAKPESTPPKKAPILMGDVDVSPYDKGYKELASRASKAQKLALAGTPNKANYTNIILYLRNITPFGTIVKHVLGTLDWVLRPRPFKCTDLELFKHLHCFKNSSPFHVKTTGFSPTHGQLLNRFYWVLSNYFSLDAKFGCINKIEVTY